MECSIVESGAAWEKAIEVEGVAGVSMEDGSGAWHIAQAADPPHQL